MKDTAKLSGNSAAPYRNRVTLWAATFLGVVGFCIGWCIPTKHPDDRFADIAVPTLGLAVLGAFFGYVFSSVYYRRMSAVDAFVCIAIPVFAIIGFAFGKTGDLISFRVLSYSAWAMIAYLVYRVCRS